MFTRISNKTARKRAVGMAGMVTMIAISLIPVAVAHASVGTYSNAALADKALTYVGGSGTAACIDAGMPSAGGGQCKAFANCVIYGVSGHTQWAVDPGGNYQSSYTDVGGIAVSGSSSVKGDIIQMGTYDSDATAHHLHTAIVVANNGNGTFDVVDSNWVAPNIVGHHILTPTSVSSVVGYYRMGTSTANSGGCVTGGLYCGGDKVSGNASTLYRCNGTAAPSVVEQCGNGCSVNDGTDDSCRSGGSCVVGGLYCGGDKVSGAADTLYRCTGGSSGTVVTHCAAGCAVFSGRDDACK